jgi:hypothetical protein
MLYASTKMSLKQEFGGGQVKDDLYGNVRVSLYSVFHGFGQAKYPYAGVMKNFCQPFLCFCL